MVQSPQIVMAIRAIIIAVIIGDQIALQSCLKHAASYGVGHINLFPLLSGTFEPVYWAKGALGICQLGSVRQAGAPLMERTGA